MNKEIQQLNNTTYKITPKDDPKDRIEVIIGDDKEQDFKPQVKLMRWDNEVNFSVRLKENGKETPTVSSKDDKVTWDKGNFKIEFYEAENAHKFVWFLKEKPDTNKVEFTIQSKGLKFYYQPELTQKEIDRGDTRPENVVGSYAVYMEKPGTNWAGGKEYKAGKFGHIYRPHLYDSNGLEAWGDLHIENGIYSVEIPQEFLDKAVFPIKSNDLFGWDSFGSSGRGYARGMFGTRYQSLATAGTAEKITIGFKNRNTAGNTKGVIVLASSVSIISNGIGNAAVYDGSDWTWIDSAFSTPPTILSSTNYVLCFICSAASSVAKDDGAANSSISDIINSYSSPQDPDAIDDDDKFSIYCTYEEPVVVNPTVTTQAVTVIEKTTATGNGNITDDGGATATRGMCWDTSATPTITDDHATNGTGEGAYTVAMTGLTKGQHYYVRAYATNSEGTSYGAEVDFTTLNITGPLPLFKRQ